MARLSDVLLNNQNIYDYNNNKGLMLDPRNGGQYGYMPNLAELTSNTLYTRSHIVALLIEAPKGFEFLSDPPFWRASLQAIIEKHSKTIDGLSSGLTVDVAETNIGGGNQRQQTPINVTREVSNPSHTYVDLYGRSIQNYFDFYIRYFIGEPETQVPGIVTALNTRATDLLLDMYSFTTLYFEPDPMYKDVSKAWLCTNMMPLSTGDITGKKDLSSSKELSEISITFSATTQVGAGVNAFAKKLISSINYSGANPNLRPALINNISADLNALKKGYIADVETANRTAIRQ